MSAFSQYILPITVLAAAGSGLMTGLLFAFSNFVMKALSRLPAEQGMAAMQGINLTIVNPLFLLLFLGTAALCVFLLLNALRQPQNPARIALLLGALLYLVGPVGVTMACNVPLNNKLAAAQATVAVSSQVWPAYVKAWLVWNHVRTILGFAATVSLTYAASQLPRLGR